MILICQLYRGTSRPNSIGLQDVTESRLSIWVLKFTTFFTMLMVLRLQVRFLQITSIYVFGILLVWKIHCQDAYADYDPKCTTVRHLRTWGKCRNRPQAPRCIREICRIWSSWVVLRTYWKVGFVRGQFSLGNKQDSGIPTPFSPLTLCPDIEDLDFYQEVSEFVKVAATFCQRVLGQSQRPSMQWSTRLKVGSSVPFKRKARPQARPLFANHNSV